MIEYTFDLLSQPFTTHITMANRTQENPATNNTGCKTATTSTHKLSGSYLAVDYFQALHNIIAPPAPMVRKQSSLIITPGWEYSSEPYRPRKSQLLIFRQS